MGAAPAMGAAMSLRRARWSSAAPVLLFLCLSTVAGPRLASAAGARYALIVTGASGGPQYAQKYDAWRGTLVATLQERFGYARDRIILLAEEESAGIRKATRDNVRAALADLRRRAAKDDLVFVLLIGHGTALDGDEGKFNLVGPDLTAEEWAGLIRPIAARLVFVNTTGGSFPFLAKIAGPGRVVLTATDSAVQQFDTVFPEFFVKAFEDEAADLDKNRKVSIWESFVYASARIRAWFEERGQLSTERSVLDDTGRGIGREAGTDAPDGVLARTTYLEPDAPIPADADGELARLVERRAEIESAVEALRANKSAISPDQYEAELEKLLLELTRIDRQIRSKS
jgi:hypothetical protein